MAQTRALLRLRPLPLALALHLPCVGVACDPSGTDVGDAGDASGSESPDALADTSGPDGASEVDAQTDGDDASDARDSGDDAEPAPNLGTLEVRDACSPSADPCAPGVAVGATFATYRKDSFFDDSVYNEYTDPPLDGGRVHIAGLATASGPVSAVRINGVPVTERLQPPNPSLDWYHVWPDPVVEGEPVWVAFHSRDPAWDSATEGHIEVLTAAGTALDSAFAVATTTAPLTWVTTSDDGTRLLVHLRNDGADAVRVERLWVNAIEVLADGRACAPGAIAPAEAALIEVPLCAPPQAGAAWTVVAEYDTAAPAVGVGRVIRPFFPIEAWPSGSDCARPDGAGGTAAFARHLDAGIDTFYYYWGGGGDGCGLATPELVNRVLPAFDREVWALVGDDFLNQPSPETLITDTSRVAGFLTGDESDGELTLDDGSPAPESKARQARRLWSMYPELPVYNGGKTNGHVGAFAGMTDIQGMDLYVAACAPHITYDPQHPPLRGAYDYLRNTRLNHMPLPTWLYAQGLHEGWNRESGDTVIRRQPDPGEVWVQAMSAVAAGAKGLMWFQTDLDEADAVPESWAAIADANDMVAALRRLLREGDPTGMAASSGEVIVEAIRAPDAIVVPVINLAHTFGPTDLLCLQSALRPFDVPHWRLGEQRVDVDVQVPDDLALHAVVEVTLDGRVQSATWSVESDDRSVRIHDVVLSQSRPVAVYVLVSDPAVRQELERALAR